MPALGINLTDIRTQLVRGRRDKLRAFATITLQDSFVVRDLKLIEGPRGLFVAMPSRRVQDRCPGCACKNHVRAKFCNECGRRLRPERCDHDPSGRARLYADIAHPIRQSGRDHIQQRVLEAYARELDRARSGSAAPASAELEDRSPECSRARGRDDAIPASTTGSRGPLTGPRPRTAEARGARESSVGWVL